MVPQAHDDMEIEGVRVTGQARSQVAGERTDVRALVQMERPFPCLEVSLAYIHPDAPYERVILSLDRDLQATPNEEAFSVHHAIVGPELDSRPSLALGNPLGNGGRVETEGRYTLMDLVTALAAKLECHSGERLTPGLGRADDVGSKDWFGLIVASNRLEENQRKECCHCQQRGQDKKPSETRRIQEAEITDCPRPELQGAASALNPWRYLMPVEQGRRDAEIDDRRPWREFSAASWAGLVHGVREAWRLAC